MLIPFIDVLYALAIGTGFMSFPKDPFSNVFGTVVFIYTLFIAAQDWYEYHDKAGLIPEKRRLVYFILQIFVILALNQMFAHSVAPSLVAWLIYGGVFCLLNVVWNIITPFERHLLYAGTSGFLSVMAFLFAGFYQSIVDSVPIIDGRWLIFALVIVIPIGTIFFERIIDR